MLWQFHTCRHSAILTAPGGLQKLLQVDTQKLRSRLHQFEALPRGGCRSASASRVPASKQFREPDIIRNLKEKNRALREV